MSFERFTPWGYEHAEPPANYDPGTIGFEGEMPRGLAGYRGEYVPRPYTPPPAAPLARPKSRGGRPRKLAFALAWR